VLEYFLFDPEGRRFQPPLRAFRLRDGALSPAPVERAPDGSLRVASDVLGLVLVGHGSAARWLDPGTGKTLPMLDEWADRVTQEKLRAQAEKRRAALERRRARQQQRRAEEQQRRADEQQRRAAAEAQRAAAAEAEVARLRAALARVARGR
jgi:hypothetical protein